MPAKSSAIFSLNPIWPRYGALFAVALGLLLGLFRYSVLDIGDGSRCTALEERGQWLDDKFRNWQPDGCMMHNYNPAALSSCVSSRPVVFIGDSVARKLFFRTAHLFDKSLPTSPPDNAQKHADHLLTAKDGTALSFFWDPFLNTSHVNERLSAHSIAAKADDSLPALLVLGSGLWYLRYANDSGGLPAWEARMDAVLATLAHETQPRADQLVILPIEEIISSKLTQERAATMQPSDVDAMNSDLIHRVSRLSANSSTATYVPTAFNLMLDPSQTEDGLHFSDAIVDAQASLLLNRRCNQSLPPKYPFDSTCCKPYPRPHLVHSLVLLAFTLTGPLLWYLNHTPGHPLLEMSEVCRAAVTFSGATALIYLADRSGYWLKEQKQFNPWTFGFLILCSLAAGLSTMKRADKDLGFLNREQTDEWKGWMQIAILIYHYTGASKISGIYNPIRVLVAAYLFMTGYGHTTYYIKKADFGLGRIIQVLVRLNLFTFILAYAMNTDYLFYYFSPLISAWFCIIYLTMAIAPGYNDRAVFLAGKIIISLALVTWFMHEYWLLEKIFELLKAVFNIHWSAKEWAFRFNLDLWIVYFGMVSALGVIKAREHRITDHPRWPLIVNSCIFLSTIILFWFFAFELTQESKFTYNAWHPYVSFLPIVAFVVLRNATPLLRSASSRLFAFIGTCSLETFIIQYHLWLAGDTKGILLIIPGTGWRPVNAVLTTIIFVFVSNEVARATGHITSWICDTKPSTLPTAASNVPPSGSTQALRNEGTEAIPLMATEEHGKEGNEEAPVPDPIGQTGPAPVRWMDRLAEGANPARRSTTWAPLPERWSIGANGKLAIVFMSMWALNIFWTD